MTAERSAVAGRAAAGGGSVLYADHFWTRVRESTEVGLDLGGGERSAFGTLECNGRSWRNTAAEVGFGEAFRQDQMISWP